MNYWLMKSEPDAFSISDLAKRPKKTEPWDGIRNYQARNFMRDGMKKGDLAFFYHSSCDVPGIVGIMKIVKEAYPDSTQFDPESKYHDPGSKPEDPRWLRVDVQLVEQFDEVISLNKLKEQPFLEDMQLLKKGNRLSILPVTEPQWHYILGMRK